MKYVPAFTAAFLTAVSLVTSAFTQDRPVSVETNLVTMNVSVSDKNGNYIRGLKKDDFNLRDNGEAQAIDVFSAEDSGLSIGIVYDNHNQADDLTLSVLEALKRLSGRLGERDDYFVSVFNDKGSLTTDFVPDADQLRRHLANPDRGTPNSLYDAIFAAADRAGKLKNSKKYLLVVTNGTDRSSDHSLKQLRLRLRNINMPVYVLSFTPENRTAYAYSDIIRNGPRQSLGFGETSALDRSVIDEISKSSGGQAFESSVRNRVYLAGLATKLLEEARSQYVIGFYPESADGRWHKLSLKLNGPRAKGLKVSSRKGYQNTRASVTP